jgi:hypothetical protein
VRSGLTRTGAPAFPRRRPGSSQVPIAISVTKSCTVAGLESRRRPGGRPAAAARLKSRRLPGAAPSRRSAAPPGGGDAGGVDVQP